MFNEIEELMQAIEKFKSNIANSDELLNVLKNTAIGIERSETHRNEDKEQLTNSLSAIARKMDEDNSAMRGELKKLADEISVSIIPVIQRSEANRQAESKQTIDVVTGIARKMDEDNSAMRGELKKLADEMKGNENRVNKKINLIYVFLIIALALMVAIFRIN